VEIIKYSGIIIDDRLRFKNHCDYMLKKIDKKISFLNRIGKSISTHFRRLVYKSIVASRFEHCATLMINIGETQLSMLRKVQNRAMRVISHCDKCIKIDHMLRTHCSLCL